MNQAIADGFHQWLNANWEYRCPVMENGQRCHRTLIEFTTYTMICDVHGMGEKEFTIPWALCESQ